ncbi:hypothetical protein [Paenibacillus roseipurpureus]|uniref:Uncharacterized protein n=1 Tax=Paenibacillus roseopurpureus TaxID=2918901 RepID=A0AA96LKD6_9BACL|nr:hypothetical protein [Paenibacillus sp. MBLB1832]WNR42717.1 hypothetical protein MJB10_16505 [Paenibacillus sp. MBLB1832]
MANEWIEVCPADAEAGVMSQSGMVIIWAGKLARVLLSSYER